MWPCHAPQGDPTSLKKILKNLLNMSYSMLKELWKKTTLIFAKTLVCPCHAPRGGQIFLNNELHDTKGILISNWKHTYKYIYLNILLYIPYSGLLWRWKSGGFGLSPPYFSRSIIFPAIIKRADSAFWIYGGMGHDTLHVAFYMFNKHI